MKPLQASWFPNPAGMGDDTDFLVHIFGILFYPFRFVLDNEASLQMFIMRGNSCWTGILVALHRLDATERKHEAARRIDKVSADA